MATKSSAALCLALAGAQALSWPIAAAAEPPEAAWTRAGIAFDNQGLQAKIVDDSGNFVQAEPEAANTLGSLERPAQAFEMQRMDDSPSRHFWGPGGRYGEEGLGPVSRGKEPGYMNGLLGGIFGVLFAPVAFAAEVVQAVAFTPVRMVKALAEGELRSALEAPFEPLRTMKNLAQDAVMTAIGMLNSVTAPVWNALDPEETTDFRYANNRLIFQGGPLGRIQRTIRGGLFTSGFAPSWHTVFTSREFEWYEHECVHNVQWKKSFLWERVGHWGDVPWDYKSPHDYLNW